MKKIFSLISALIFIHSLSFAQAPQGINYQGVARDQLGNAISKTAVSLRFSVLQGSNPVYVETHSTSTDTFGLYNAVIGQGSVVSGTFSSINWGVGTYSVKVEIDPAGGSSFNTISTTSLMSVPYALYAASSGSSSNGSVTSLTGGSGIDASPATITSTGSFSLSPSGVTAGQYGNASSYPVITVDNMGRVTAAGTQTVSSGNIVLPGTGLTSTATGNTVTIDASNGNPIWNSDKLQNVPINSSVPSSGQVLQYNGSQWTPGTLTSVTSVGTATPVVNSGTSTSPVIGITQATNGADGYLSSADWNTFNNKVSSVSVGGGGISSTTAGTNYTLTVNNAVAQWNANQLQGQTVNAAPPVNNDVLQYIGGQWKPGPAPSGLPSGSNGSILYFPSGGPWAATVPANIFTDGTKLGIGTNGPMGMVDVVTGGPTGMHVINNGSGYGIDIQNSSSSSSGLHIYHPGNGSAAYFSSQNTGNTADALYVETYGPGNAIKGYTNNSGSGIFGYSHGPYASGAAVYGYNDSIGSAGVFRAQLASNSYPALVASTNGTGYSAKFTGGSGVQIDNLQVQTNLNIPLNANNGFVLTSDATGNASWQPASGSGITSVSVVAPLSSTGGSAPTLSLQASGVTTGTYGSGTQIAQVTVDSYGRVTNATNIPLAGGVLSGGTTNYLPKWTSATSLSSTSLIYDNGTGVGVNSAAPTAMLDVVSSSANPTIKATSNASGPAGSFTGNGAGPAAAFISTFTGNPAATFTITSATNTNAAIIAGTAGTGPAAQINGPLKLGSHIIDGSAAPGNNGDVLISQGSGLAPKWLSPSAVVTSGGGWLTSGNSLTGTGILGSTNAQDVVIRTSGTDRMTFKSGGFIGINQASPTAILDALGTGTVNVVNVVNTGTGGNAGFFNTNSTTNTSSTLKVVGAAGGSAYSGDFSGGLGVQMDKARISVGASPDAVLVSSNSNGDAVWAAPVNFSTDGGASSSTSGSATTIAFATVNYCNPSGAVSAGTYTVPVNGLYHFDGAVAVNISTGLVGAQDIVLRILVNGGTYRETVVHLPNGYTGVVQNNISVDALLATGQTVRLAVFQSTGQSLSMIGGAAENYFNGHIVR